VVVALTTLLAATVLAPLLALLAALPASASQASEAVVGGCEPGPDVACVQANYPGAADNPVPGIRYTLTTPSGETIPMESDESGIAVLQVDETGEYTVRLEVDSLPEGVLLQPGDTAERTRPITRLGSSQPVGFVFNIRAEDYTGVTPFTDRLAQSVASGLRLGLVLALAAVGLSLIYGTTGLSSFSHAEQVTLGGIVAFIFVNRLDIPFLLAAVLTVVFCGLTGLAQDAAIWRPLRRRGLGLIQLMIVTIGLSLAMQYAFQVVVGARTVRVISSSATAVNFGPITLTDQSLWSMGICVVVLTAVGFALLRTRLGRATRAVSDNPALAAASGIDVDRVVRIVWVLATALAGLAGILLALVLNGVKWDSGMQVLLLLFAAVTLGGLGTAFGALVGALIIGLVVELTPVFGLPGDLKYATALLILILLLMVRPQGILGKAERVG